MNISVVIPNFNGEFILKKNLFKVVDVFKKYSSGKVQIIIADDASKDGSIAFLETFLHSNKAKNIQFLLLQNKSGKNKGFAGNVNSGVRAASGEIIIFLNTDVVPENNFLDPLLAHFKNENVFAVGCMDKSIEEGKVVLRGRGIGQWYRGFLMHKAGNIDTSQATLWVSCGSGAFRKSMWDTLGGLQELYNPFYWEDIDLSYRAQKAGYITIFEKESIVTHEHEKGSIKKNYSSFTVKKTAYRNQFFFTWLNATDTIILVKHAVFLPYFLLIACIHGDNAFLTGFYNALLSLPKALVQRVKVQKLVKKTDKEVIAQFIQEI